MAAWILQPAESTEARAVPGLVLVHGAGRGSRESLVETAQAFAAAGTAVIIYDKRTAGYSVLARDFALLAEDAIDAANVLANAPGVDRSGYRIVGFSEGAGPRRALFRLRRNGSLSWRCPPPRSLLPSSRAPGSLIRS